MTRIVTSRFCLKAAAILALLVVAGCGGGSGDSTTAATSATSAASSAAVGTSIAATSVADPLLFSASTYSIAQEQGSVSVTVLRVGNATAAVSVDYSTVDGTAVAGTDYAATTGTLQWAENDSTTRTITVPIVGSPPFAGSRAFSVVLSNPNSTAQIATPDKAVVEISGTAVPAVGNLQLSDTAYSVAQTYDQLIVTVNRMSGSQGAVSVQYATAGGTAVSGVDFTAASGVLNWADGDAASKTFTIAISTGTLFVGSKSLSIGLSSPTGGAALGTPSSATATISGANSASTGTLHLTASSYEVAQDLGTVTVTVNRTGGSSGPVSVGYLTSAESAVAGSDFTATSGTLSWADGDTLSKSFAVAISKTVPFSGSKSFSVSLSGPVNGVTISSPGSASVVISGSLTPPVGSLELAAPTYSLVQNAGSVTVSVERTGGSSGAVSVAYGTVGGTAVSGVDFTAASGIVQWADGDIAPKSFAVNISDAIPFSGAKSFSVVLSNAGGGAVLGGQTTSVVAISGDASMAPGSLQIAASTYSVAQSAHSLTITVNRTGGSSDAVNVAYATANGSAVAGTDYTSANGTLNWAAGDSKSKSFTVSISSANSFSGTKSFSIALSQPSGGASLSSPSVAAVSITGASSAGAGTLELSASSNTIAQSAGTVTLSVKRTSSSTGSVSVAYGTNNGSASAGSNFTATTGTLNWSAGDTSPKTISVPISNSSPFSGTKTFSVNLSNPGGGATVGSPSSSTVTVTGSSTSGSGSGGTGSSGPSTPSSLYMTGQGNNSVSLSWSAPSGGDSVSHYKIYRNGSSYATANSTNYTDYNATNATNGGFAAPATIYTYSVSAVDSQGNEGPQTTQTTYNVYNNGNYDWLGDYSYSAWANYKDSSGGPESGPYDIAVTITGSYGGFQPYAGNTVPLWDLEAGSFGYISMDLKPTQNNQSWRLSMISRLPPGDVYPWSSVNVTSYGPTPEVGKWATYKVPLSALTIGKTSFQGSINGNTLTVTNVNSGVGVDAGGFVTGNGVQPGTYITGHNANGGPGTYTVSPTQWVSSTNMTEQRTGVYKFCLADQTGASYNVFYMDNVKFTKQ